jgi:hypothetical protein
MVWVKDDSSSIISGSRFVIYRNKRKSGRGKRGRKINNPRWDKIVAYVDFVPAERLYTIATASEPAAIRFESEDIFTLHIILYGRNI